MRALQQENAVCMCGVWCVLELPLKKNKSGYRLYSSE